MKIFNRILSNLTLLLIISLAGMVNANATDEDGTPTLKPLSANPAPIPSVAGSIGTLFGSDNGLSGPGAGMFFEIENVGTDPVTILSWDINTADATSVDVYTRSGTYVGFQETMTGWTLLGTDNSVVAQGVDQPTPVAVGGITINPGATMGIAMISDGSWEYTNGTGPANQLFNDGILELRLGTSGTAPLAAGGSIFDPRVWNGVVHYDVSAALAPPTAVPSLSLWALAFLTLALIVLATRKLVK